MGFQTYGTSLYVLLRNSIAANNYRLVAYSGLMDYQPGDSTLV
jgi:hypothetical protein